MGIQEIPELPDRNVKNSIQTCHVQKHGTEIIEVEVWHHFMTCFKKDRANIISDMYNMGTNVQYM